MANEQNLKPFTSDQSREAAVKNGRKGGIACAKAKRERKLLKDTLLELLAMPIENGKLHDIQNIKSIAELKNKNITMQDAIMVAMLKRALKGDARAAEYVRDTIGQKPDSRMNIDMNLPVMFEGEDDLE